MAEGKKMRTMSFTGAIEDALGQAMAADNRIIIFGEDVHGLRMNLFVRRERSAATPVNPFPRRCRRRCAWPR
jgi:hypothetical protein